MLTFCVDAGAELADCHGEPRFAWRRYAAGLGHDFQIREDLLDAIGDAALVGKPLRKDAASGRQIAVELWGIDGTADRAGALAADCRGALAGFGRKAKLLCQLADYAASRVR